MKTEKLNFVEKVLNESEKSEKEILREQLQDFVEDATLEINSQISHLETALIPSKKNDIKRHKREIENAEKAFENRFKFALENRNVESYVENRNRLESQLLQAKEVGEKLELELKELQEEVKKFQEIVSDFK